MHDNYSFIVDAVNSGRLQEPFKARDLISIGVASNTASTFLAKHANDNPGNESVMFQRQGGKGSGEYKLVRPLLHDRLRTNSRYTVLSDAGGFLTVQGTFRNASAALIYFLGQKGILENSYVRGLTGDRRLDVACIKVNTGTSDIDLVCFQNFDLFIAYRIKMGDFWLKHQNGTNKC